MKTQTNRFVLIEQMIKTASTRINHKIINRHKQLHISLLKHTFVGTKYHSKLTSRKLLPRPKVKLTTF